MKAIGIIAAMLVSGAGTLFVTVFILLHLGMKWHGKADHYTAHPAVMIPVWGVALAGFLTPGAFLWSMKRRGRAGVWKIATTLAMMVISGVTCLAVVWTFGSSVAQHWRGIPGRAWAVAMYGLVVLAFLTPGAVAWCLNKKGEEKP